MKKRYKKERQVEKAYLIIIIIIWKTEGREKSVSNEDQHD